MTTIYEDESCIAYLNTTPAIGGHVSLEPKQKYTIVEQIPDEVMGHLTYIANILSGMLFEMLGAEGTNIIINNGAEAGQQEPQVTFHILPRKQNDGLNFQWQPKEIDQERMDVVALKLQEGGKNIVPGQKPKAPPKEVKEEAEEAGSWVEDVLFRKP